MKGVLILGTSTGVALFYKAYASNLGLNLHATRDGTVPRASKKDPQFEAMFLSNFVSALYSNVRNLTSEPVSGDDSLHSLDTGEVRLHFAQDPLTRVLVVISMDRAFDEDASTWFSARVLRAFVAQFQTTLLDDAQPMSTMRFRKFAGTLSGLFNEYTRHLALLIPEQIDSEWRPSWMYAHFAPTLAQNLDVSNAVVPKPPPGKKRWFWQSKPPVVESIALVEETDDKHFYMLGNADEGSLPAAAVAELKALVHRTEQTLVAPGVIDIPRSLDLDLVVNDVHTRLLLFRCGSVTLAFPSGPTHQRIESSALPTLLQKMYGPVQSLREFHSFMSLHPPPIARPT
jgi:hypothetical protein